MENNREPDAGQSQTRPLTDGTLYFHFIVTEAAKRTVTVPKRVSDLLPFSAVEASVSCGGRWWRMIYQGNWYYKRIQTGWPKFVQDNEIELGDACVFEVLDRGSGGTRLKFAVQILRGGGMASGSRVDPDNNAGDGTDGTDGEDPIIVG